MATNYKNIQEEKMAEKVIEEQNEIKEEKKTKKIHPGKGITRIVALIIVFAMVFATAASLIFYLIQR